MKKIMEKKFPNERDLYGISNVELIQCSFDGVEDGESALKEARNISLLNCYMNLRYPLWHDDQVELTQVTMTEKCRAALWYSNQIKIQDSKMLGIKALRECSDVKIVRCEIQSPEFGWKSSNIEVTDSTIQSEYLFFLAKNIELDRVQFKGKYSFQYVDNMIIENSFLDTKDAFWHTQNVTVKNSIIKGEYLAWYSKNLTLINCKIIGTQPFCYCEGLKLVDCEMEHTDFSFEYSDVEATIHGEVLSIKNPKSGKIMADKVKEVIYTKDSKYPMNCKIIVKEKE